MLPLIDGFVFLRNTDIYSCRGHDQRRNVETPSQMMSSSEFMNTYQEKSSEIDVIDTEQSMQRFLGVGRLFQKNTIDTDESVQEHIQVLNRLSDATVAVVGLGGVGSWAAEALCRSGVGNIILVDLDDICISNVNRQLHALSSTVGNMKIDEMEKRLHDINPACNVTKIHDFVTTENVDDIINSMLPSLTVCLDAIDGHIEKSALIAACCVRGVPIVTCGGAAGRTDPTMIVCDDLSKASECRLLFQCKKKLRDEYKLFAKGPDKYAKKFRPRKWRVFAVFSTEVQKQLPKNSDTQVSSLRRCDGYLGTASFVTGTYGLVSAGKVVSMIADQDLKKPKILRQNKN